MIIDITRAVIRDQQDQINWTDDYVNWLVEYVGPRVDYDPSTCLGKGEGWVLYSDIYGFQHVVLAEIQDTKLANLFALRWL
jgi:hypothetical protein